MEFILVPLQVHKVGGKGCRPTENNQKINDEDGRREGNTHDHGRTRHEEPRESVLDQGAPLTTGCAQDFFESRKHGKAVDCEADEAKHVCIGREPGCQHDGCKDGGVEGQRVL